YILSFLRASDAIELRGRPQYQILLRYCGSCHAHLIERILPNQLIFRTRLNDIGVAILAQAEDPILVRPWRCGKRAGRRVNPLLPVHLFSGASIVTGEESPIEQRLVVIPIYQRRRIVRAALRKRPGNKLVALLTLLERNVSGSTRADGKDRALLIAHIT